MGAMGWMFASEIFGWCFHKGRILEKFRLVEASALGLHTLKRNHLAPFGRSRYMFMYMFMYMYIEYRYIYTYISSNYALLSYLRSLSYLSSFLPYFLGKKKQLPEKTRHFRITKSWGIRCFIGCGEGWRFQVAVRGKRRQCRQFPGS